MENKAGWWNIFTKAFILFTALIKFVQFNYGWNVDISLISVERRITNTFNQKRKAPW